MLFDAAEVSTASERDHFQICMTGYHGRDVVSQRLDGLDHACLKFGRETGRLMKGRGRLAAIDFGCGSATFGSKLAEFGLRVLLVDLINLEPVVDAARARAPNIELDFMTADIRLLSRHDFPQPLWIAYGQRVIHYIPFRDALEFVNLLYKEMSFGGKLFVSASGLESELGNEYPGKRMPVDCRFFNLRSDIAEKHSIYEKICLYQAADLERLASENGFHVEKVWISDFGNVKGIFVKK